MLSRPVALRYGGHVIWFPVHFAPEYPCGFWQGSPSGEISPDVFHESGCHPCGSGSARRECIEFGPSNSGMLNTTEALRLRNGQRIVHQFPRPEIFQEMKRCPEEGYSFVSSAVC